MLRADNVICGTTTTGTGTLTLAATPVPPGGIDFDAWLKATGYNFVSTNAVLVSYTIIEYTSSAFTTAKQTEKGIGTLTLGASIAAATLARTTIQSKATSMDSQPATPTYSAPTAITIGTAANTLVFLGVSVSETLGLSNYVNDTSPFGVTGFANPMSIVASSAGATGVFGTSLHDFYTPFFWATPMLVKRVALSVQAAYTGGTSNAYGRIYAVGSDGKPGKLLYDFGLIGTSNASLGSASIITSGASGNGFLLNPGVYFMGVIASYTGGSGTPDMYGSPAVLIPTVMSADEGGNFVNGMPTINRGEATTGTAGAAPDPANLTGYSVAVAGRALSFCFKGS